MSARPLGYPTSKQARKCQYICSLCFHCVLQHFLWSQHMAPSFLYLSVKRIFVGFFRWQLAHVDIQNLNFSIRSSKSIGRVVENELCFCLGDSSWNKNAGVPRTKCAYCCKSMATTIVSDYCHEAGQVDTQPFFVLQVQRQRSHSGFLKQFPGEIKPAAAFCLCIFNARRTLRSPGSLWR